MNKKKRLDEILSNTSINNSETTKRTLSRVIRRRFDETESHEEAEALVTIAYWYQLPFLDSMLNDFECIPELPF